MVLSTIFALHERAAKCFSRMVEVAGLNPAIIDSSRVADFEVVDGLLSAVVESAFTFLPQFTHPADGAVYVRLPWGIWARNGEILNVCHTECLDAAFRGIRPGYSVQDFLAPEESHRMLTLRQNLAPPLTQPNGCVRRELTPPQFRFRQCPSCPGMIFDAEIQCPECGNFHEVGHVPGCLEAPVCHGEAEASAKT